MVRLVPTPSHEASDQVVCLIAASGMVVSQKEAKDWRVYINATNVGSRERDIWCKIVWESFGKETTHLALSVPF